MPLYHRSGRWLPHDFIPDNNWGERGKAEVFYA